MDPESRERLAGRPLALCDLVFVVREHQIDPARMDVDGRLSEESKRHRRTFDVPAGTAGRDAGVGKLPRRFAFARSFPEHEIARVLFRVIVAVDARPRFHALVVEPGELSVPGHGRDLEVDRSVAPIGVAVALERRHHVRHRAQVRLVGRARHLLDFFEAQRPHVLAERRDVLVRVRAQVHPGFLRAVDRAVVDVREVHHLPHAIAAQVFQRPAQHVEADEGAEIADVTARVHGQAARVHPHGVVGARRERLFAAGQRVVEAHRSVQGRGLEVRQSVPASDVSAMCSSPFRALNATWQSRPPFASAPAIARSSTPLSSDTASGA